jgi:hypothetical protein
LNKWKDLFGLSLRERIDMLASNASTPSGVNVANGNVVVSTAPDSANGTGVSTVAPAVNSSTAPFNANTIELIWRPRSIGAFNINQHLPSGNYEIELNPYINYGYNAIESIKNYTVLPAGSPTPNPGQGNYNQAMITVLDFKFFMPTCASPEYISDTTYYLSLEEYQIQGKPATNAQQVLNYVVPWSTQSLTVALQTGSIGTQTIVPPSKFLNTRLTAGTAGLVIDNNSNNLQNLQIQYSKVYPKTQYDSGLSNYGFANNLNYMYMTQRYEDTFANSQSLWQTGQQEPFVDTTHAITHYAPLADAWALTNRPLLVPFYGFTTTDYLSRGALFCVNVSKPSDNRTTDCQITIQYKQDPFLVNGAVGLDLVNGNPQILLLSSFKKTAKIVMVNGSVASVESVQG